MAPARLTFYDPAHLTNLSSKLISSEILYFSRKTRILIVLTQKLIMKSVNGYRCIFILKDNPALNYFLADR